MKAYPGEKNNLYLAFAIVCESLTIDMFGRSSKVGRKVGNIKRRGREGRRERWKDSGTNE